MQTQIRELPVQALAAGLAVLGGVAAWQLGVEFERAWARSDEGPLPGDALGGRGECDTRQIGEAGAAGTERRRWVADHHPRATPGTPRAA
jgi:hypothetical protein